jgi:hypothetical protein
MALVHWDKSVLSFHLKEIIEDHESGDRTALLGLGTIVLGAVVLPAAAKYGRPLLKSMIKSGLHLYRDRTIASPKPSRSIESISSN